MNPRSFSRAWSAMGWQEMLSVLSRRIRRIGRCYPDQRADPLLIGRCRRVVDDHLQIRPPIDREGRVFQRDRPEHGMAQMLDPFAEGLHLIVPPHGGELGT